MNYAGIQHRATEQFCYAIDKDIVEINIKTAYDVESVTLYYNDPFIGGILGGNWAWTGEKKEFQEVKHLQYHKLWTIHIKPPYKRVKYYFELQTQTETVLYFEDGFFTPEVMERTHKKYECFTFPWLHPIDVNTVPTWVKDTIWYQIFPDRFCNGDLSIDASHGKPWGRVRPKHEDTFNGDLRGILNKLTYLASLGVNGIYLTPIFSSPSNHKYNTFNYYEIDPFFGDKKTFQELVDTAHNLGMRIMLDGVFNHCGSQFPQWIDVVEHGPSSRYYDWFMIETWPFDKDKHTTKDKEFYSFAFTSDMPKLNTSHPEVIEYFCGVCEYWVKTFDIDGWRLDVANEVSHAFCKTLRKRLHKIKPSIYILGEIWHDAMPWLCGDELDSVMNYPLTSAIDSFWLQKDQTKHQFEHQFHNCYHRYMKQTNDVLFNLMDSHDTDRLLHRVQGDIDVFYQQLLLLFTAPGSVCLFYGTEIAMDGSFDPDCRACMPWEDIEKGVYDMEIATMKKLIKLRKEHPACKSQDIKFVDAYEHDRAVVYLKQCEEEVIKVTINASMDAMEVVCASSLFERGLDRGILRAGGCLVERI